MTYRGVRSIVRACWLLMSSRMMLRAMAKFTEDCGTESTSPCEIHTYTDLKSLSGESLTKNYILMNDIKVAAGDNFFPIRSFRGLFEGNGHSISDLNIDYSSNSNMALFGSVFDNAQIRNLILKNPRVRGRSGVGALVGTTWGHDTNLRPRIHNIVVENPQVEALKGSVGGLVGDASSGERIGTQPRITACHVRGGMVTGKSDVGGLIGTSFGSFIDECSAEYVKVNGNEAKKCGGLIGSLHGEKLNNSYAACSVTGCKSAGGLVGNLEYEAISNSYARSDINVSGSGVGGGLIGTEAGYENFVESCFATGSLRRADEAKVGGLIGTRVPSRPLVLKENYCTLHPAIGNSKTENDQVEVVPDPEYFQDGDNKPMSGWDDGKWVFPENSYPSLQSFPKNVAGGPYFGKPDAPLHLSESLSLDEANYQWTVDSDKCAFSDAKSVHPMLTCSGTEVETSNIKACVKVSATHVDMFEDCRRVDLTTRSLNKPIPLDGVSIYGASYLWTIDSDICVFSDEKAVAPVLTCSGMDKMSGASVFACRRASFANSTIFRDCTNVAIVTSHKPVVSAGGPYNGNEGAEIPLDQATSTASDIYWSVDNDKCAFVDAQVLHPILTCRDISSVAGIISVGVCVTSSYDDQTVEDCTTVAIRFEDDCGTEGNKPCKVSTYEDLQSISKSGLDKSYILTNDIQAPSNHNFVPIGELYVNEFTGTFDGNGFAIRDLFIKYEGEGFGQGLFGSISVNAEIRNLVLDKPNVTGTYDVGALVGHCSGQSTSIHNVVINSPTVRGISAVGGAVGKAYQTEIRNVFIRRPTVSALSFVGAVMGNADETGLSCCHATGGRVSGLFDNERDYFGRIGGLVGGFGSGRMEECSANDVMVSSGKEGDYFGGLVGSLTASDISNCFATGSVKGKNAGGLVGEAFHRYSIRNSFSRGDVNSNGSAGGGLIGKQGYGAVEGNFATGSVTGGADRKVGGLVGFRDGQVGSFRTNFCTMNPSIGNSPGGNSGVKIIDEDKMPGRMKKLWDNDVWTFRGSEFPDLECFPELQLGGPYSGSQDVPIHLNKVTAFEGARFRWTVDNGKCSFNDNEALNPVLTCHGIAGTAAKVKVCAKVRGPDKTIFRDCTTVSFDTNKREPFPGNFKDVTCAYSACVAKVSGLYGAGFNSNGDDKAIFLKSKRQALSSKTLIKKNRRLSKSLSSLKEALRLNEELRETAPEFSNNVGRLASSCAITLLEDAISAYRGKGILDEAFLGNVLDTNLGVAKANRKAKKWKNSVGRCQVAIYKMLEMLNKVKVPLC